MITTKKVTIYVSDAGNGGPKKYHSLFSACMREAFHALMRQYRKTMTEAEFEAFRGTDEFDVERRSVAKRIRDDYRKAVAP